MLISALYGSFVDKDVYLIGTGPSMSVFPKRYLLGKTCVLLNDAWRYFPELGPVAFSNTNVFFRPDKSGRTPPKIRVVKARLKSDPNPERDDNHVRWDDPDRYCFSYREPPWDDASHFDVGRLWAEPCHYWNMRGGTVAIFAVQFAVMAGARSVTMVGCDCCDLDGEEYLSPRALKFRIKNAKGTFKKGLKHDYEAYASGLRYVADRALADRGVSVTSMSPFFGFGHESKQLKMMRSG